MGGHDEEVKRQGYTIEHDDPQSGASEVDPSSVRRLNNE
jgi:hypothetical protein